MTSTAHLYIGQARAKGTCLRVIAALKLEHAWVEDPEEISTVVLYRFTNFMALRSKLTQLYHIKEDHEQGHLPLETEEKIEEEDYRRRRLLTGSGNYVLLYLRH